jgi:hypothetical protein
MSITTVPVALALQLNEYSQELLVNVATVHLGSCPNVCQFSFSRNDNKIHHIG